MKKDTVTVSLDAEKLRAIKRYMGKKDADLEAELVDQLQRLYEKFVPPNVREYIEENDRDAPVEKPLAKQNTVKSKNISAQKLPEEE